MAKSKLSKLKVYYELDKTWDEVRKEVRKRAVK